MFDYWTGGDSDALATALGLKERISAIRFEVQFPTGLRGTPPNLDVVLTQQSGFVTAIESKFSEWLTAKRKGVSPFRPSYFHEDVQLWEARNLPECQKLAHAIHTGTEQFRYLDVPQLLKHALGLSAKMSSDFALYYVYFDWPGPEAEVHREEIRRFEGLVGDELRFPGLPYQDLFRSLETAIRQEDESYLSYLQTRYGSEARA